jgi:hypothetical protein
LAVFSVIALFAALGLAALVSLQPWAANSVAPQLSVAPDIGVALGDSVVVARGRQLAVAPGHPAAGATARLVTDEAVAERGVPQPQPAIAAARVVTTSHSSRPPESSPKPPPSQTSPQPLPPPGPAAVPVSAPAPSPEPVATPPTKVPPGSHSPGPITSGPIPVGGDVAVQVHEGDEKAFSFSFVIESAVYRSPGDENLIMRFKGVTSESPSFGLQLWDDGSGTQRGLWASGDAMGGERFLAPVEEGAWHEAVVYFKASSEDDGAYVLTLDGEPIDAGAWVGLIDSDSSSTWIETGLFRDGEQILGTSDIVFGPTEFGDTAETVIP